MFAVHPAVVGSRMGASIVCGDAPGGLPHAKDSEQGRARKAGCMEQEMTKSLQLNHVNSTSTCPSCHVLAFDSAILGKSWEAPVLWVIHPPLLRQVGRNGFRSWLGCAPIAADQIGKAVWHPLWLSLRPRLSNSLADLKPQVFPQIWRRSCNCIIQ